MKQQYSGNEFLRIRDILGDRRADPPIAPLLPISRSTWWKGVKEGRYPKGRKLSRNITVWRLSELLEFMEDLNE